MHIMVDILATGHVHRRKREHESIRKAKVVIEVASCV